MAVSASPRLHIVTGKGGVGKTTTAIAIAMAEARRGRVLLAEANAGDSVTQQLGARPVGSAMREVLENLWVVDMNPRDSIHEYALLTLRFETVYRAVFGNRLVRHFINLVPSLGELTLLGKLWYHEAERDNGGPRFDTLVLDAPATGHAISMLRTPAAVAEAVPTGAMRENTRLIVDLLTDHQRTVLHVVTTPEEMPVNEALELRTAAHEILGIRMGRIIVNQRVRALPRSALMNLRALQDDPALEPAFVSLRIREQKIASGERHLSRLLDSNEGETVSFPRLVTADFGPTQLEQLSRIWEARA